MRNFRTSRNPPYTTVVVVSYDVMYSYGMHARAPRGKTLIIALHYLLLLYSMIYH